MITSRSNSLVQHARQVRDNRVRSLMFVEGVRLSEEAVRAGVTIEAALHTEKMLTDERALALLGTINRVCEHIAVVSDAVMEFISDTKTSQGVVLLAERPSTDVTALDRSSEGNHLIVFMHQVSNPANAGAMLRVAEAAGVNGVIATKNSVDLFSAKALRGAMGSSFRMPLWTGADFHNSLRWCADRQIRTISTSLEASQTHTEVNWCLKSAIIIGAEGEGLSPNEVAATDMSIRIPMRPPVESLNVAVALGIVLYEAVRQRG